MGSERAWVERLLTALGGLGAASAPSVACDGPPQYEAEGPCNPRPVTACFTKSELLESLDGSPGGAAGVGGGGGALEECPAESEILDYPIAKSTIGGPHYLWSVESEDEETCCYSFEHYCVGRRLVVQGEPVVAPTRERADWVRARIAPVGELDDLARQAIARAWERDAALEHASVASFAHFILDLLNLGAPHALLLEAYRALGDEIRHAELCYALASRYSGKLLGPGPLRTPAFEPRSPRDVAIATLAEGCIAETLGVCFARERLVGARDTAVAATLERIVEDEERHAELAFRFLGWAIEQEPSLVRDLDHILTTETFALDAIDPDEGIRAEILREHGVLTGASRLGCAQRGFSRVIAPCHRALRAMMS